MSKKSEEVKAKKAAEAAAEVAEKTPAKKNKKQLSEEDADAKNHTTITHIPGTKK